MSIRYIQAAVSQDLHTAIAVQAAKETLTVSELLEKAVMEYIKQRKEEEQTETVIKIQLAQAEGEMAEGNLTNLTEKS